MTKKRSKKKEVGRGDNDEFIMSAYSLYPPDKDYTLEELRELRAHYCESELMGMDQKDAVITLMTKYAGYADGENKPMNAIEAFLVAHENGMFPPMWVLNYLFESFLDYHNHQGEKSMDKSLGLKRGKGQPTAFQELHNRSRDQDLMMDVGRLQIITGCSVDEACHMVARLLEELPDSVFKYTRRPTFETMRDTYYRGHWKNVTGPGSDLFVKGCSNMSEKDRTDFLSKFPEDSFPIRLRHLLP